MKKLTIISDSCCDLKSADLTNDIIDFVTVPISYSLGGVNYQDDENNDVPALVIKMKESKQAPKSACPPPETFADVMRRAQTKHILVITISTGLSGTFNSARLAAETVTAEMPDKKIFVFDSYTAAAGLARVILKTVDLVKHGDDFDTICAKLPEIRSRTRTRFLLNDLSTLVKTGRMSKVLGLITSVIPLKLICGDNGAGEIVKHKQVLGLKKGLNVMAELPGNEKTAQDELIVISHCNNLEGAGIIKTLLDKFGFKNIKTLIMRGIATFFANDKGITMAY